MNSKTLRSRKKKLSSQSSETSEANDGQHKAPLK